MDRNMINRRQLLKSAAMGVTAVQLAPGALAAQPGSDDIEIAEGMLTALGNGWLEIQEGTRLRRFSSGGDTSFWKGGESTAVALKPGDDLMIKAVASSERAIRVWSNLSRVQGKVIGVRTDGFVLQTSDVHAPQGELLLRISERTLFGDAMTYGLAGTAALLSEGDSVDAIGEQIADGLNGALVYLYRQGMSSNPRVQHAGVRSTRISANCMQHAYLGYATWFNCSTGAGRCGTCNTANSSQLAWPALDTCGCCSSGCCDCSKNCYNQVYLSCGSAVTVYDECSTKSRACHVVDCGPCQEANCSGCSPQLCWNRCSDCAGFSPPVVDLTKPTFAYFYDPATRGCFSCQAVTACV